MIYCHVMLVNMLQMSGLDSGKGLKYRKDNLVIFSFNIRHMMVQVSKYKQRKYVELTRDAYMVQIKIEEI